MNRSTQVLVVDDERFFREAIREVLDRAEVKCVLAASGAEALEAARDESIGVVILDIRLPDQSGLEVFRQLRDTRPDLRVIILSAHTDQESVLEALRLGAFDYLAKPIHEEELSLAVRRALETFGVVSGWSRLRHRIVLLEKTLEELWEKARETGADEPAQSLREGAVQAVSEILGAARTSLMLLDEDGTALRVAAARGFKVSPDEAGEVPVGEGVAGTAMARSEPILVDDVDGDERFAGRAPDDRYASNSFAVAPLAAGTRALGVLCATERTSGEPFGEEDLALMRIMSVQLAQMLDVRRGPAEVGGREPALAEPSEERAPAPKAGETAPEAELARAICEAVTAEVEPARILEAALRPVAETLQAAPVSLYLLDAARRDLVREVECDRGIRSDRPALPTGLGLTGTVIESGTLIATDDPAADPRFEEGIDTPEDGAPGPFLCGALRFRGKALGVFRAFPERPEDASPRVGEVLAAALSAAVRNVLLYRSLVDTIDEVARARREGQGGAG
jgi:DNA-binding NarL/FixJ family response regulator